MKIKSDETPKQNRLSAWLKKHQASEISKTITMGTSGFLALIACFMILQSIMKTSAEEQRESEQQVINDIIKYKPVIKYYTKYFLPDEYELMQTDGRNTLFVTPKGLEEDTIYLSNCSLMLSKKVTDSFREAVYKKRGYITVSAQEEARLQDELKQKKLEALYQKQEAKKQKELAPIEKKVVVDDTGSVNTDTAIHSYDYYQRKAYADGYNPLVLSYTELETYKLTKEYKSLKRFERTKELEELNASYNKKRAQMWSLHYKFGLEHGSYEQLEEGKLKVNMLNGQLQFRYDF